MATEKIIRDEEGLLSFGDFTLTEKTKAEDFPHAGDLYKVKTFNEITKLEKNGAFLYESVPGTSVTAFNETAEGISFTVTGTDESQITLGVCEDGQYDVFINDEKVDSMNAGLSGKLSISVDFTENSSIKVKVVKQ